MPNGVTYSDEKTLPKVYTALAGNGDLDFPQTLAAVSRLQDAGILFREEVPAELRSARRTSTEVAADTLQAGIVEAPPAQ